MTPLLSLEGVCVTFRGGGIWRPRPVPVVRSVSFDIPARSIVALVGASGSGKSTVARAIARLVPIAAGALRWEGADVLAREPRGASRAWRQRVQLVFQDPFASLNPVHPVGHPIARALRLHGHASAATVDAGVRAALEGVGLTPAADFVDRYPAALSGGQRQRVALAAALAVGPALLLADEPTSMLDVSLRADVLQLFRRLRDAEGRSVLLVTHDLPSARTLADRAVVLFAGAVAEDGPAATVLAQPAHPYARALVAATRHGALSAAAIPDPPATPLPTEGCAWAPQCDRARAACRTVTPPRQAVGVDHHVFCHNPEPGR
jgi:peptide/nickel transport system ATP-binding protein